MAPREDLVAEAVKLLREPTVAASSQESKIAFLTSKNLTQEEIDLAFARAAGEPIPSYSNYAPQQQVNRQPQPQYGGYPQYPPWPQQPPPVAPQRDWRDWFIMATVVGGVGYGLFTVAKNYVYPIIAPPTAPQLAQDKQEIDSSFASAFALLDQLGKDTDTLKKSEEARTERLDTALSEVERTIADLKAASRSREDESRRINEEMRGLKELIPKAMDGQKEATDARLRELTTELKSLKTLMGQRLNPSAGAPQASAGRSVGAASTVGSTGATNGATTPPAPTVQSEPAEENPAPAAAPTPSAVNLGSRPTSSAFNASSPFNTGAPAGSPKIPAWQMAASKKASSSSLNVGSGSGSQDQAGA